MPQHTNLIHKKIRLCQILIFLNTSCSIFGQYEHTFLQANYCKYSISMTIEHMLHAWLILSMCTSVVKVSQNLFKTLGLDGFSLTVLGLAEVASCLGIVITSTRSPIQDPVLTTQTFKEDPHPR